MTATTTPDEPTRRDFLFIATTAVGAVGAGFAVWPLVAQMNPDATTLAAASTEVDIGGIAVGQVVTVKWRGKPVFVMHRTPEEIAAARAVALTELPDPESDEARVQKPEWLVTIAICTHLGCVPLVHQGPFKGAFWTHPSGPRAVEPPDPPLQIRRGNQARHRLKPSRRVPRVEEPEISSAEQGP
jgi:ubiquinol-cytochrome c reductase iron-sulfur subunit